MRIIAGEFRRRKLLAPDGLVTRPIPDRVKESLFGMLGARVEGAAVLDLFAGTGSIGLEAVSRGAASCVMVERDRRVVQVLQTNIETLGPDAIARCKVVLGDALGQAIVARSARPTDLIFFDPPYPIVRNEAGWSRVKQQAGALAALLPDNGFLILRTPWPFLLDPEPVESADGPAVRRYKPKGKNKDGRGHWRDEAEFEFERTARAARKAARGTPEAPEAEAVTDDDDDSLSDEAATASQGAVGAQADLSIPGTIGPETHRYGSTAVHWYMRARDAAKPAQ